MPMDLLFVLAQSELPVTIRAPSDIDRLRVLAAAQLVQARLPDVGAQDQTAEVLAISQQGHAALAKTYPHHQFNIAPASAPSSDVPDWLPSLDTCRVERDATRTTLDS